MLDVCEIHCASRSDKRKLRNIHKEVFEENHTGNSCPIPGTIVQKQTVLKVSSDEGKEEVEDTRMWQKYCRLVDAAQLGRTKVQLSWCWRGCGSHVTPLCIPKWPKITSHGHWKKTYFLCVLVQILGTKKKPPKDTAKWKPRKPRCFWEKIHK